MEPPVSDPNAQIASPAATEAPDPPLEPPGTRSVSHGLRVVKKPEFSVEDPMANSSRLALPTMTASAAASFSVTVASYGGTKFASIFEAHVVLIPFVHILSFNAPGIPASGETVSPRAIFSSTAFALAIAVSCVRVINDRITGSVLSARSNTDRVISTADTSRRVSFSCNSCAFSLKRSIPFSSTIPRFSAL